MITLVRSWLLLLAALIGYDMNYAGAPWRNVAVTLAMETPASS